MSTLVQSPFEIFLDQTGAPLQNGNIYIGTVLLNPETNPITVYWDAALTIPAVQPIRTSGGYPVRNGTAARVFVTDDYSITVKDKNGVLIFSDFTGSPFSSTGLLTKIKSVDGSGSGLIAEGLQSVQITDLNFDPTLLGLAVGETRIYYTSLNPANPWAGYTGYYSITLTKETAVEFRLTGVNGNTVFTRQYSSGWGSAMAIPGQFDFVVNSSAALAQWRTGGGGFTYTRVYIIPGSFSVDCTGASGNAGAGEGINLTLAATKVIVGSVGSTITFTNQTASTTKGCLYYTSQPATPDFLISGVTLVSSTNGQGIYNGYTVDKCNVTVTMNTAATLGAISTCQNVSGCSVTVNSTIIGGSHTGYLGCAMLAASIFSFTATVGSTLVGISDNGLASTVSNISVTTTVPNAAASFVGISSVNTLGTISDCLLKITGGTAAAQVNTGISSASPVSGCNISIAAGSATAVVKGFASCQFGVSGCYSACSGVATSKSGFDACTAVSACQANIGSGVSTNVGFNSCAQVSACVAIASGAGASVNKGFNACSFITASSGSASGGATNRAFDACTNMGFNKNAAGGYNVCFADTATNAVAATAAGGYNV